MPVDSTNKKIRTSTMSPTASDSPETAAPAAAAAPAATAGAWLREVRQQRGLHIAALAAMLKVPQAKLEALEANRFEDLPDITFARALAKAMCRVLKVDPTPVMDLLPSGGAHALDVSRGINQAYRERGGRDEGLSLAWLQRPMVWVAGLFLLAAAAVVWVPSSWFARNAEPNAPVTAAVPDAALTPESTAASAPVLLDAPEAAVATASASAVVAAALPVPTVVAAPLPAGAAALAVKVTGDSWVEIVDARGQVLLSRLLKPGDAPELSGMPPFKVKVGNVSVTELSLRGSKVDLAAQSKDNVARLELN
jgi:cytoskeleton protein RodZ